MANNRKAITEDTHTHAAVLVCMWSLSSMLEVRENQKKFHIKFKELQTCQFTLNIHIAHFQK